MLYHSLEYQAAHNARRPAILYGGSTVTYEELFTQARRIAAPFVTENESAVAADRLRPVGLLLESDSDAIAAVLAALAAGIIYVPLDSRYPVNRLRYMLADSACRTVLTNNRNAQLAQVLVDRTGNNVRVVKIEDLPRSHMASCFQISSNDGPAYILYTSGSTGRPKGILQSQQNLLYFAERWIEWASLGPNDRITMLSSFSHDASLPDLFGSLLSGATLCVYDVRCGGGLQQLADWLVREQITVWHSVPTLFRRFAEHIAFGQTFPKVRLIALGGERVRETDINLVRRIFPEAALDIIYGQTESTITSLWRLEKDEKASQISIGKPIGTTRVFLSDEQGMIVAGFGSGEIVIASQHVALGYWRNDQATSQVFTSDQQYGRLFWTGDRGLMASDGSIRFSGRADTQLKIRGHRVEPAEVELILQSHPAVSDAAVVSSPDSNGDDELYAFYVSQEGIGQRVLRDLLLREVPDYMIPRSFTRLEELPLLENGKVDSNALSSSAVIDVQPVLTLDNELQIKVAALWKKVLGVKDVGSDSDFFEQGGQSLTVLDLLSAIHETFLVELSFQDVLQYRTIAQLANLIENSKTSHYRTLARAEAREFYELASAQKRMFVLCHFDHIGTTYNMPLAVDVEGDLDRACLERAVRELIARHECLRTSFRLIGGTPVQIVQQDAFCEIKEARVAEDGIAAAIEQFVRPFDLGRAPLLRLKVLLRDANRFTILLDIHHIICDGGSRDVLVRDLIGLYRGEALERLTVSYKDYAVAQSRLARTTTLAVQEKYWIDLLADGVPKLGLPADFQRPTYFSFKGSMLRTSLNESETERFRSLAASQGATLFMTAIAAFAVVLQQRTSQSDIVIGVSVDGRRYRDLRSVIGMFVNEVIVWNRPRGEMRFSDFLSDVRSNLLQALANSDVQFENLVERLNPERDLSRNPLFTVCMSMSQALPRTVSPVGTRFTRRRTTPHFSKFDLTLFVCDDSDRIHFDFEYCTDLFRPVSIAALGQQLAGVIDVVCTNPQIPLADLAVETVREPAVTQRVEESLPFVQPVHGLIEEQCRKTPEAIALRHEARTLSFGELEERANQVAHYLRDKRRVQPSEPIALLLDNSIELVIAILGTLKAGAAYVPIDVSCPEARVRLILNDTRARVILSQRDHVRLLNRLQWDCPCVEVFACLDSSSVYEEVEKPNVLMNEELWNYVGSIATDAITGGGWTRSDTGLSFSAAEMAEYVENTVNKIDPFLHPDSRVLEIGCGSGLTLFSIAPRVGFYCGTDLSRVITENTSNEVRRRGLKNVVVKCLAAHDTDCLDEGSFDLIILNSVVQSFHGHNYLRKVIAKSIGLLKREGHIFLGDLMDADRKDALIQSLECFAREHDIEGKTKLDWSAELFVSPAFFYDLPCDFPEIVQVETADKWHTIENELTKFRFDALLTINRNSRSIAPGRVRRKWQDDWHSIADCATTSLPITVASNDVAYITYTSGTTGRPKGVVVEHRSLANYVTWATRSYKIDSTSYFPLCTPISFDLTLTSLLVPLAAGGRVHIHKASNAALSVSQALCDEQLTAIKLTPSHLALLHTVNVPAGSRLRTFIVGGENLTTATVRLVQGRFSKDAEVFNEYGPTEATVGCMVHRFDDSRDRFLSVPIGTAIDNVSIYLLDERQRPVRAGTAGELYISGAALARGYLNCPADTALAFLPDPFRPGQRMYRTGDLAWLRPNESIEFLGRVDEQLKLHGHRIEPEEIEACIRSHPEISQAALGFTVSDNESSHDFLCAYFVARRHLMADDLRSFLKRRLPEHMIPNHFIQVSDLKFNRHGKLDRRKLSEVSQLASPRIVTPGTSLERQLAAIWSEVLGVGINQIGLDSNFFALGGHSLSAVALVSHVRSQLGLHVPLADVFQFPELESFVGRLRETDGNHVSDAPIQKAESREYYPASRSQESIYRKHAVNPSKYNRDPIVYELKGDLDLDRFRQALQLLLQRHEILRTSFREINGEVVQQIHEHLEMPISVADCDTTVVLNRLRSEIRSFRLEELPLWRVHVMRTDPRTHYLMFDLHHILYDAESIAFLLDELGKGYRSSEPLPAVAFQYKDYAVWERMALLSDHQHSTGSSFQNVKPARLRASTGTQSAGGHAMLDLKLQPEAESSLQHLSQQLNCTRLSILLAAFFRLVARESGASEMALLLRVSMRRQRELQGTVGPFLNKVPVRARVRNDEPVSVLAKQVQENLLSVLEHSHLNGIQPARFPILVNYQTVSAVVPDVFGRDLMVKPIRLEGRLPSTIIPYDFVLGIFDEPGHVRLRGLYNGKLYEPEFVRRLLERMSSSILECDSPLELISALQSAHSADGISQPTQ